jgi:hypothetical protein
MERFQIHLTRPQMKALRAQAKAADTTVAELIRRAVDAYLTKR